MERVCDRMLLWAVFQDDLCQWNKLMSGKPHGASVLSHTHTHTPLLGLHLSQLFDKKIWKTTN